MAEDIKLFENLNLLKNALQQRTVIEDADLFPVFSLLEFKQFDRNETITDIGKIENYVYFILDGVTRSYFFKDEKEISLDFHFTGDFFSVYESFIDRLPATHGTETLTPVSVVRVKHDDIMKLYKETPKFEQIGRLLTEEQFKKSSNRVKELLSLSATERYLQLLNAYPQYVKNIPLKYLASYLHITPESLSRIRKNL